MERDESDISEHDESSENESDQENMLHSAKRRVSAGSNITSPTVSIKKQRIESNSDDEHTTNKSRSANKTR